MSSRCFFFQAEDGIRDAQESRGLGDVYKRQSLACAVEMYVAGTFPLVPGLVALGLYHAIIGVIEGIVTAVIIYVLLMARPDLVETSVGVASA